MRTIPKLSETMARAVKAIEAGGGWAAPEGGGWWKGADGQRLKFDPIPGSTAHALGQPDTVQTQTIFALEARGILKRTGKDHRRWLDTYVLVPKL